MPLSSLALAPELEVKADPSPVVPMYVCPGCRPAPLEHVSLELGEDVDAMQECPCREVCTWYAGHDLGGETEYTALPEPARLAAAFQLGPYFSCPNYDDHEKFIAAVGHTQLRLVRARIVAERRASAPPPAEHEALTAGG
jgi:hypothetical protein